MATRHWLAIAIAVVGLSLGRQASASCSIHNDTSWSFTVTSGNTSNQQVGSHTQTSIAAGKIVGTSKEGKTIGGFCKDGDKLEIKDEKGVPILLPK